MAEQADTPVMTPTEALGADIGALPGVTSVTIEKGEVVALASRDALLPLMTTLRDGETFAFEQVMDICGVDWPERAERFDVVYNLLSVSLNQRARVIITTDATTSTPTLKHFTRLIITVPLPSRLSQLLLHCSHLLPWISPRTSLRSLR